MLGEAIGELVENLHSSGIVTAFSIQGENQSLPIQIRTGLYRVAQEGLTNVSKHANASAVEVKLTYEAEQITLAIEDNGTGQQDEETRGFGLVGLRERLALLGGSLQAGNRPEGGYRLSATVPRQVKKDE
jgi:signal transduction histidine kinase